MIAVSNHFCEDCVKFICILLEIIKSYLRFAVLRVLVVVHKEQSSQQMIKSDNADKKNMGYHRYSCLRTDNNNVGEESGPSTLTLLRYWLQDQTGLGKSDSGQGHRTSVPFILLSRSLRQPWAGLAPHIYL